MSKISLDLFKIILFGIAIAILSQIAYTYKLYAYIFTKSTITANLYIEK